MIIHGREREVARLTAAMLQQGWRGAACHVSQSACLAGVQAQELGLVACAGKHWRQRLQLHACCCWCMMRQTCCLVEPAPISWQPTHAHSTASPLAWTALSCFIGCRPTFPFMCSLHRGSQAAPHLPHLCLSMSSPPCGVQRTPKARQILPCGTATLCSHSCTWGPQLNEQMCY